jgi:hypothetical protein
LGLFIMLVWFLLVGDVPSQWTSEELSDSPEEAQAT